MRIDVLIGGFGGQGIIFAAKVLASASALQSQMYVLQTQSYGPEARGGACRSEVIFSDQEVNYPKIIDADYFLALSENAYTKYIEHLKGTGVLIVDSTNINIPGSNNNCPHKILTIDATEIAEGLGDKLAANIVMLGALSSVEDVVSLDYLKRSLEDNLSGAILEMNLKAIEKGNLACKGEENETL